MEVLTKDNKEYVSGLEKLKLRNNIWHQSLYEDSGYIPIYLEMPPALARVKLIRVRFIDWNIETLEWSTEGWYRDTSKIWSLKDTEGLTRNNSTPTHWKYIGT